MGVFFKVENGGCFLLKKVDLFSMQGALCTVSVFFILHFTYLGGAYTPNAPPAYGPDCTGQLVLVSTWSQELEDFVRAKFYCRHALADGS